MKKYFCLLAICLPLFCQAQNQSLTIVLDWFINPDHAPLFVAEQDGFFKAQGLDVKILPLSNPNDGPKYVAVGKADIALTYEPQLLLEKKKGLPLEQFATLVNQPLDCVSVLESSAIHSVSDLKGKSIGSSDGAVDHLLLQQMLADHHISLKAVNLVNVRYNLTTALMSEKVNAVSGFMRNVEPIQMQLAGKPTRNFYPEENGVPPYAELIWVSHNNPNAEEKIALAKFTIALQEATAYLKKHPDKTWQQFAKAYPQLNNPFNHDSWMMTLAFFDESPGILDVKQTVAFEKFMNAEAA
jgi:putative hydroxymethylpyrimidine transport system substrate-binding protein